MSQHKTQTNDLPYPTGDFFNFEGLLPTHERERLHEVRSWLDAEVRPIATDYWNRSEFPMELIPKIAALDIISPVRRQGHSHLFAGLLTAEIHRADASVGTFMSGQDGLFTGSIELLASEEQKAAWLPDIYALRKTGVFAITEPLAGSDVAGGTRTTAVRDGDTWVLNGEKRWIGNSTFSDYVIIWAKDVDDEQVKGFLVDTKTPGFSATLIQNRISLRSVQNADIKLTDLRISDEFHLAGANSFRDTNKVLKSTRATVGWQAVGLQMAAFDVARKYGRRAPPVWQTPGLVPTDPGTARHHAQQLHELHGDDGPARAARGRRRIQKRTLRNGQGFRHQAHARNRRAGP
ncbi:alkylation response protein AidB-like acyl-CoA dehydrogenase [Arthrobacter sp. UYCu723]